MSDGRAEPRERRPTPGEPSFPISAKNRNSDVHEVNMSGKRAIAKVRWGDPDVARFKVSLLSFFSKKVE